MSVIRRYELSFETINAITMHRAIRWLDVQIWNGKLTVWAVVDEDSPRIPRDIYVVCTGHLMTGKEGLHIGTAQDAFSVWHVFTSRLPDDEQL